jgi:Fe-S cluster assembly iron-binding protein IscA
MSIVKIDQRAYGEIICELTAEELPSSIRIEICSTGCCDASLGLRADKVQEMDLVEEIADLKFLINSEVYALTGNVSISYIDESGRKGFVLTSQHPLNEWEGFGVCQLKK